MTLNVDLLKQLATVDGLLAGFALAASVRFVAGNTKTKITSATIATLLFSSLTLITTASLAVLLMGYTSATGAIPNAVEHLSSVFIIVSLLGLSSFLAGIALVGWGWSQCMGIASTIAAVLSAIVIWLAWLLLPQG